MRVEKIPLTDLRFSENRNYGGEGDIKILAEDIKTNGLINPITVLPIPKTGAVNTSLQEQAYEVVAGRRRVRAVTLLKWEDISCRILEGDEIDRAEEIAGAENINRLAMHPLDEADYFKKLLENGDSIEELAKRHDRKVSEIWQRVQLLGLYDGIKELFRDGKITLHAAAMLKSLDEERQIAFYEKYNKKNISIWDVKGFISSVRHDKLFKCITGKDCAKCQKRTYYTDKALFPELSEDEELCLDHECYMGKWEKLISAKIKEIKSKHKDHADAKVILCNSDDIKKSFGKTITVDGIEYTIIRTAWDTKAEEKPAKTLEPCFLIRTRDVYGNTEETEDEAVGTIFELVPLYWKEPEKKKEQEQKQSSPFAPVVKLLDMPKEEAEQAVAVIKGNAKEQWEINQKAWDIIRKAKQKTLQRVLEIIAKNPEKENDKDRFLKYFIDRTNDSFNALKLFAGSKDINALKKLSTTRLFAALYAATLDIGALPNLEDINTVKKNEVTDWAGIPISQLKEMYKEELKALMPKTKPKAADAKPAETKPAKAKPTAKKTTAQKKPAAKKPTAKKNVKGKK